jgi:hypothetical protein
MPDENSVVLLQQVEETPQPPRRLLKYGHDLWNRVWGMGATWVSDRTDLELLTMTCEMVDERWNLRVKVMQTDDATMRRGLRELDRQIVSNLSLLGFTPSDRSRLGVAEVKAKSKLEELMERRATRSERLAGDGS